MKTLITLVTLLVFPLLASAQAHDTISVIVGEEKAKYKYFPVVKRGVLAVVKSRKGTFFFLVENSGSKVGKLLNENGLPLPRSTKVQYVTGLEFEILVRGRGFSTHNFNTGNWSSFGYPYQTGQSRADPRE